MPDFDTYSIPVHSFCAPPPFFIRATRPYRTIPSIFILFVTSLAMLREAATDSKRTSTTTMTTHSLIFFSCHHLRFYTVSNWIFYICYYYSQITESVPFPNRCCCCRAYWMTILLAQRKMMRGWSWVRQCWMLANRRGHRESGEMSLKIH